MRLILTAAISTILAATLCAQQPPAGAPPGGRGPAARSAEVSADGRITFRLAAPKASEVLVNGNWSGGRGLPMTKDASGLWTLTTEPVSPELWTYSFSVDGATTLDPGNYHVVRDGTRYLNSVLVPGAGSAL